MTLHASLVDDIINFENGDMNDETTIEFFQKLIDGGMAWTLQGSYGRMATRMIEAGVCHRKGARVNKAFHARHRRGQGAFVTARTPGPWSLVAAQEQAIRQMMEPRTSDGRQRKHQWSVLKHYRAEASKQGFTDDMIKQHIRDIRDMCALESEAE